MFLKFKKEEAEKNREHELQLAQIYAASMAGTSQVARAGTPYMYNHYSGNPQPQYQDLQTPSSPLNLPNSSASMQYASYSRSSNSRNPYEPCYEQ